MSDEADDVELHDTRVASEEESGAVTVRIPKEAIERAGITPGQQVMVGSSSEAVSIIPWDEEEIREAISRD